MREVSLFAEDFGHEAFILPLIARMARESRVDLRVTRRSVRGGYGKVIDELGRYLLELDRSVANLPDLLVVATDANCRGYSERKRQIEEVCARYRYQTICAVPDPHIERWMLIDSAAFKIAVGKGCAAPDMKCRRDRYKELLLRAVREASLEPLFGGMEHADTIVSAMDLDKAVRLDSSLGHFITAMRSKFNEWTER